MAASSVRKASDILSSLFGRNVSEQAGLYSSLFSHLSDLVGTRCVDHCKIQDVVNNVLIIAVDHPVWLQTLQFQQQTILYKAKKRFPELGIRGVSFVIRNNEDIKKEESKAPEVGSKSPEKEFPALTEEQLEKQRITLETISDPLLRNALEKLRMSINKRTDDGNDDHG